ncbi:sensor histidine kinase [Glaciecola sp. SC05]|uniref:sensor histidine kinase n=1 Tax=Glaciecola sp. SC05 TaxID=1987355 RepID=UPI0035281496
MYFSSLEKQILGQNMFKSLRDKHQFLSNYASMRYWQVAFWGFLFVVNFFTLTLWYSQASVNYVVPVLVQSVLGLLFSLILQYAIIHFWQTELWLKSVINLVLVATVSLAWTVARMYVFELTTGEAHIWTDFGGWFFSSIFIFISWCSLFYGIQYYRLLQEKNKDMLNAEANAREAKFKRMEAQATARDAQLEMLRYQLNPHFLCNTLNAINALIEVQENEKAQKMSVNLSQFLRYSLDNIPDGKIKLEKELETLTLYLEIEKTRFEDRLKLEYDIQKTAEGALVPSLILQPIIENSMKHAIAKCEHGGKIRISAEVRDEKIHLFVEDSGGPDACKNGKVVDIFNNGVGLKNTEQRLKILYDTDYSMTVSASDLGGIRTQIIMPLEYPEQKGKTAQRSFARA